MPGRASGDNLGVAWFALPQWSADQMYTIFIGFLGVQRASDSKGEMHCLSNLTKYIAVGVLLRCGWRQWQLTYHSWTGAVHSAPLWSILWSTLPQPSPRESKPQSITCYDHQDLLRQVRTWFKRIPKVKKCKSAFGKNYLGECVAQAKVDFWHFCSVSDCEDCDLCNNAGISLPVSPASTAAKDGMSMYCWVLFIQRRYANLCYQRSYDKRRLTEHLIVDLAFIFAALQRKGSGPH